MLLRSTLLFTRLAARESELNPQRRSQDAILDELGELLDLAIAQHYDVRVRNEIANLLM
jgi:hypothetical protein